MMKRAIIAGCLLLLVLIALLESNQGVRGIFQREAFFKNRPSSYWREKLRADGESGRISVETKECMSGDNSAIPVLLACLDDSDRNIRWPALILLASNGREARVVDALRMALDDTDDEIQLVAIQGLGNFGNEAFGAVPQLVRICKGPDQTKAGAANVALWRISPNIAAKSPPWHTFSSPEHEFRIELPGQPEETRDTVETPFGLGQVVRYSVAFAQAQFDVAVVEYPPQVAREFSKKVRYESARDTKAQQMGGEVKEFSTVNSHGVSGRQVVTEFPGKGQIHERVFLLGNRAYMAMITNVAGLPVHSEEATHFLNSFRITHQPLVE